MKKTKAYIKFKPTNKKERTYEFDLENYKREKDKVKFAVKKNNNEFELISVDLLDITDIDFVKDDDLKEDDMVNPLAGW